ncbi:unnamed protein product [Ostreobium quekettii]|uniref:Armadillo-type fold n=1 Tax=Ostreobium quekettii TaxID=121088 RepID=A0A8S1ITR1_9CHLO|nr:unnamed protein product [Ostreobium quekettii]
MSSSIAVSQAVNALVAVIDVCLSNGQVMGMKPPEESATDMTPNTILARLQAAKLSIVEGCSDGGTVSATVAKSEEHQEPGSWRWVVSSGEKVSDLLKSCLPPLVHHPGPSVRCALAEGAVRLLSDCSMALGPAVEMLLGILLTLAQDDWEKVKAPCHRYLLRIQHQDPSVMDGNKNIIVNLRSIVLRLSAELADCVRSSEAKGAMAGRGLLSAMIVSGPVHLNDWVFSNPVQLSVLCTSLCKSFSFDSAQVPSLLQSSAQGGLYITQMEASTSASVEPKAATSSGAVDRLTTEEHESKPGDGSRISFTGSDEACAESGVAHAEDSHLNAPSVASALPRMPVALAYITTERCYNAVAGVARGMGGIALYGSRQNSGTGCTLLGVVDSLLEVFLSCANRSSSGVSDHWQLHAASAVTVLSQVMHGTSAAFRPSLGCLSSSETGDYEREAWQDSSMEDIVLTILNTYMEGPVWGLQTNRDDMDQEKQTIQDLGENAILVRAVLECVGVCASVLGPRFARNGRLLRSVLMPVLERLGDPTPFVSSAAEVAVGSICIHCGYPALSDLISANGDYIVDGLCTQLRSIDRHPRAPFLFAALFKQAGVAPELLPLMAEPARLAFKGLSIMSRHVTPWYTPAFLQAASEIVNAATAEGEQILQSAQLLVHELQARTQASESGAESEDLSTSDADVEEYFRRCREHYEGEGDQEEAGVSAPNESILLTEEEEVALENLSVRLHAAAVLASSAVDLAAPLMLSKELRVSLLAMAVCASALGALTRTSSAHAIDERLREDHLSKAKAATSPVRPAVPMLLPAIHRAWPSLLHCLKDTRGPAAERALDLLAHVIEAGGGSFMDRRLTDDAWPILQRLLERGCHGESKRGASDCDPPPNASLRIRKAALDCVSRVASCEGGRTSLRWVVAEVVDELVGFWAPGQPLALREASSRAVASLAAVDADVVWLALTDLSENDPENAAGQNAPPPGGAFPEMRALLPKAPAGPSAGGGPTRLSRQPRVTAGLAAQCGGRARAVLEGVVGAPVAWHRKARDAIFGV